MDLEHIVAMEQELRNGLLRENYQGLTEQSGQRCAELLIIYFQAIDTLRDKDIYFLNQVGKIADTLLKERYPLEVALLEKIYTFDLEGAEMSKKGIPHRDEACSIAWEAAFLAHAGNAAETIFRNISDLSWAERWYDAYHTSASLTLETNPEHSLYAFAIAGNAAQNIFKQTKDSNWGINCYNDRRHSAEISKMIKSHHSVQAYEQAGRIAHELFRMTKDIAWGERWYETLRQSAGMELYPRRAALKYYAAAEAATELSRATKLKSWTSTAIECHELFMDYFQQHPDDLQEERIRAAQRQIAFLKRFI